MPRRRKQSPPPPNLSTRPKRSRRLTQKARSALTDEEPVSQPQNPQIINAFPVPGNVEPLLPQQSGESSHTSTNSDPLLVALLEEVRRQGQAIQALQTQRNEPPPPIVPPPAPAGQPPAAQATLNVLQAQPTPAAVQPSSAALATVNTLTSAAAHSAQGQLSTTTLATANAQPVVHASPADKVSGDQPSPFLFWDEPLPDISPCTPAAQRLQAIMISLIRSSVQPTTLIQYRKVWTNFCNFHSNILQQDFILPVNSGNLGLYVSHLADLGLQPTTIQSHLSAIRFVHKMHDCTDPTQSFLITKIMIALHKKSPCVDKRRPITLPLLMTFISDLNIIQNTAYHIALYSAMYSLAYFACLRVGELATSNNMGNVLDLGQVTQVSSEGELWAIQISFSQYKHSGGDKPILELTRQTDDRYCPVKLLQKYLALRPSGPGPVFVSTHGKPISRQQFLGALHSSVRFRSLDPSLYNTHSFRIGRSTDMMFQGYSDAQIRAVGRWKSDAYKRYIRPDIISA